MIAKVRREKRAVIRIQIDEIIVSIMNKVFYAIGFYACLIF